MINAELKTPTIPLQLTVEQALVLVDILRSRVGWDSDPDLLENQILKQLLKDPCR